MLGPHILGSCLVTLRMRATRVRASFRCSSFAMAAMWLSALTSVGLVLSFDTCASNHFFTHPYLLCTCPMCSSGSLLPELLGKPEENSFGASDVAEPIRVFVLDHFADELRAAFAEPGERIVDVLHGEHDA